MKTKWHHKLFASIINVLIVYILAIPLWLADLSTSADKVILIVAFFVYELLFLSIGSGRDPGMMVVGSYWQKHYSYRRKVIYAFFYAISFASVMFWVRFPLDVLVMNLLLLQLPSVLLTGTTLHGWLAGMISVVRTRG